MNPLSANPPPPVSAVSLFSIVARRRSNSTRPLTLSNPFGNPSTFNVAFFSSSAPKTCGLANSPRMLACIVATPLATISGLNARSPARFNCPSTFKSHGRFSASEKLPAADRFVSFATNRAERIVTVRPSELK